MSTLQRKRSSYCLEEDAQPRQDDAQKIEVLIELQETKDVASSWLLLLAEQKYAEKIVTAVEDFIFKCTITISSLESSVTSGRDGRRIMDREYLPKFAELRSVCSPWMAGQKAKGQ